MDKKSRQKLSRVYDKHLKEHGFSMRSLAPTIGAKYNKAHQEVKFQFVLDQLDETNSLLDVGCGLGHLAEYCRKGAWKGKYTGIDISRGMVEATKVRLKTDDIYQIDILEDSFDRRCDVVACISTVQQNPPYEN